MRNLTIKFILAGVLLIPLALFGQSLGDDNILKNYINNSTAEVLSRINPSISFENNYNHSFSVGNPPLYVLDSINTDGIVERYAYDELGRVVSAIVNENGVLLQEERYTYLGETAQVDTFIINSYTNGVISDRGVNQFNYDNDQVLESISTAARDLGTGEIENSLTVFEYDAEGVLSSYSIFGINDDKSQVLLVEFDQSFDEQGRLESEIFSIFPDTVGVVFQIIDVFYDSIPDAVLFEVDQPAQGTGFSGQIVATYNEGIQFEDLIYPSMADPFPRLQDAFELEGQLAFVENTFFDLNGAVLAISESNYFWTLRDIDTSVSSFSGQNIEVYPNPVNDFLKFQIENQEVGLRVEIYNLMGQKQFVKEGVLSGDQQIDVSSLSTGMYFFTLQDDKQVLYSGKFLKE